MRVESPEWFDAQYLATDDPRAQSGFRGSAARWEAARRPITRGIDAPGALLDVGCANGLLMESLTRWSSHAIEPYGVDFAPALVARAKERLPVWDEHIFLADVSTWAPPRAFDFVHVRLDMLDLRDVRSFGRRVIVSSDGSFARTDSERAARVAHALRSRGWTLVGETYARDDEQGVEIAVAWT